MELGSSSITTQPMRTSECEVCGENGAKYTCPRCELRTCCLECVKIHKKELECSGLRDKVKFKTIKKLNSIDLLNDYRLLEETARLVNKSVKLPPVSCHNARYGTLPSDLYRLKCTALSRGVQLTFLPPNFSRRNKNTSHLDHDTQDLFWRVDWVFVQAENFMLTDEHVLDSTVLSTCVHQYIDSEEGSFPSLVFYQAAGHTGITFLLKAEKAVPSRYHVLDAKATLRENLYGKSILEYPVVYVILSNHIDMFNIFTEDEEEMILKRRQRRRHHNNNRNKHSYDGNNFLFSNNTDGHDKVHEEMQCPEGASDFQETSDCQTPFEGDGFLPHRGRGHQRNHYRGRNRFNFKRNGRGRRRNPDQFHQRNPSFDPQHQN